MLGEEIEDARGLCSRADGGCGEDVVAGGVGCLGCVAHFGS